MDTTNLYIYRIEDVASGVVEAESNEKARETVINAYLKHYTEFNPDSSDIQIDKVIENRDFFTDFPNVLEVADMGL